MLRWLPGLRNSRKETSGGTLPCPIDGQGADIDAGCKLQYGDN